MDVLTNYFVLFFFRCSCLRRSIFEVTENQRVPATMGASPSKKFLSFFFYKIRIAVANFSDL